MVPSIKTNTKTPIIFKFFYGLVVVGLGGWIVLLINDPKPMYYAVVIFFAIIFCLLTFIDIKLRINRKAVKKQLDAIDKSLAEISKIPPFQG